MSTDSVHRKVSIRLERSNQDDNETWLWSALVAAPLLMFANLVLTHALSPMLCRLGGSLALHLMCASCALPTVVITVGAVRIWRQREDDRDGDDAVAEETVLPELASIVAALATLVVFAQWLVLWLLPPCL